MSLSTFFTHWGLMYHLEVHTFSISMHLDKTAEIYSLGVDFVTNFQSGNIKTGSKIYVKV